MGEKSTQEVTGYERIELDQVFAALRQYEEARIQTFALLVTANLTALGLGLSYRKAGAVLLAPLLLLILMVSDLWQKTTLATLLFRGYQIEKRYSASTTSLLRLYLAAMSSGIRKHRLVERFDEIVDISDVATVANRLRAIFFKLFGPRSGPNFVAIVGGCAEIAFGVILLLSGWPLF